MAANQPVKLLDQPSRSSTKHSSGPWTVSAASSGGFTIAQDDFEAREICTIKGSTAYNAIEDKAERIKNARLISAAPELLQGLRKAVSLVEQLGCEACGGATENDLVLLKRLIAEASGEF